MRQSRHDRQLPVRLSLIIVLACGALGAGAARATETRLRSLGGVGDFCEDPANVLRWYGCLASYGNTALLELGEFGRDGAPRNRQALRQGAGGQFRLGPDGRDGTLGAYLARHGDTGTWPAAWNLLYGRAWSSCQIALLFGVNKSDVENAESDASGWARDREDEVFGLGGRCDLGSRAYLDLAGEWRGAWLEYRDPAATVAIADRSWGSFGARGRLFWKVTPELVLVPYFAYARDDRWELDSAWTGWAGPYRLDAWSTRGGLGLNLLPSGDVLGIVGLEVRRGRHHEEGTASAGTSWSEVVARLGLEARLLPWLSLRAGALTASGPDTGVNPDSADGLSETFDLTLGLGLHLGDLDADFLLNDDAPFNAGSLLTNAGSGEASTFTSVSLAYRF